MEFTITQLVVVALALTGGSILQSTIGFASGLVAIPAMLMANFSLPEAVMICLIAAILQNLVGCTSLRGLIAFPPAIRPIAIRLATLPVGALLLLWTQNTVDSATVRQVVGVILGVVLLTQWTWRVEPKKHLHAGWEFVAFGTSGILAGFCGMGGSPMVLWVMAHRWSAARSRAFLFLLFLSTMIPQVVILIALFGADVVPALILGLLLTPVVLFATLAGLRIADELSKTILRRMTYCVLCVMTVTAIVVPWIESAAQAAP
ncbi:MAG: TSUP family transporter [Pirellulales bacterium]